MNPLGIERLCLFGMPPTDHVALADMLGCRTIGIGLDAMQSYNPHGYPAWSLKTDPVLRRAFIGRLADHDVTIGLCEGFGVTGSGDVRNLAADLDIAAELGAARINVVSVTRDLARTFDGFARLAEMAADRGMEVVTEIGMGPITSLEMALEAIRVVARPDFKLLIDTMHLFRFGGTIDGVAGLDPALIGYVQLCDAPAKPRFASYMDEALHERLPPGEGDLPLQDFVRLVPAGVSISLEVPRRSLAERGIGPRARIEPCVRAARAMLGHPSG
jgi:sugar phosphate isomerase/epimerase